MYMYVYINIYIYIYYTLYIYVYTNLPQPCGARCGRCCSGRGGPGLFIIISYFLTKNEYLSFFKACFLFLFKKYIFLYAEVQAFLLS